MSARVVYLNGDFVPESAARVSIYDSALVMGDMAYEVTRTFHHQPFRVREHLQRLFHSLGVLRIDPGLDLDALHVAHGNQHAEHNEQHEQGAAQDFHAEQA